MRILALVVLVACGGGAATTKPAKPEPAKPAAVDEALYDTSQLQMAMVLLDRAVLPDAAAVTAAYGELAPGGPALTLDEGQDGTVHFTLGDHLASLALMDAVIPDGEAEAWAPHSLGSIGADWSPPPHRAHLIAVLFPGRDKGTRIDALRDFTRFVAAVTVATDGLGVYWGDAGATHEPGFLLASVKAMEYPVTVWNGIQVVAESDDRSAILSMGMGQLGLPDLVISAPHDKAVEALEYFFDLLLYVAKRGEALPEGDTVGRTAAEALPVHYVASPIDHAKQVWRVELP